MHACMHACMYSGFSLVLGVRVRVQAHSRGCLLCPLEFSYMYALHVRLICMPYMHTPEAVCRVLWSLTRRRCGRAGPRSASHILCATTQSEARTQHMYSPYPPAARCHKFSSCAQGTLGRTSAGEAGLTHTHTHTHTNTHTHTQRNLFSSGSGGATNELSTLGCAFVFKIEVCDESVRGKRHGFAAQGLQQPLLQMLLRPQTRPIGHL